MTKTLAEKLMAELTKQASQVQKVVKDQKKGNKTLDDAEARLARLSTESRKRPRAGR